MGFIIYFAVLAAIAAIGILLYNYNKKKYTICVNALITQCDVQEKNISSGDHTSKLTKIYIYTCEYYYGGKQYTCKFRQGGSFQYVFAIGQKTEIYIDPDRPDKAILSHTPDKIGLIVLLSILGLLALAGIAILVLTMINSKIGPI
jgi:hypothetical protein